MRYMLIHCVDEQVEDHPELAPELEASLNDWLAATAETGQRLDGGRLAPARMARTVRVRGGQTLVSDGPFVETKEHVAGYDVIRCADLDEALEIAARHVTARLGTIEIRPFAGLAED